ncbi:glycine cleavage system aminomethyltransferase GcvT [Candidatus Woesearchaeota archaeon]|nr:glycine cleavage system aminomethyltransferase GcvT [Candidatus Woesearchaeota archaeon]
MNEHSLKKTPLADVHKRLGAKMVDFGGWYMPVQYTSIIDEHLTTRAKAGLFDICHMGEFIVKGPDSRKFLQRIITNNADKLYTGKAVYSLMCYENGTTVDDLFVYQLKENEFMLVVNASTIGKDFEWMEKHLGNFNAGIENISEQTGKLDLQGPLSERILKKAANADFPQRFHFIEADIGGIKSLISRTGYTAEDGFELYFPIEEAVRIWNLLLETGREEGLKPIGLGARDTLRLEACYPLYGHEINENITPVEADLGWAVKTEKEEDFIGKTVLEKQKKEGTERSLAAFEMLDRGIPREHYEVFSNSEKIGYVTSGTFSPTFKKPLGRALLKKDFSQPGKKISINIRGRLCNALVVKKPFYSYNGGK